MAATADGRDGCNGCDGRCVRDGLDGLDRLDGSADFAMKGRNGVYLAPIWCPSMRLCSIYVFPKDIVAIYATHKRFSKSAI
jgi:hypothetical protein